jgi:hypothetical protein
VSREIGSKPRCAVCGHPAHGPWLCGVVSEDDRYVVRSWEFDLARSAELRPGSAGVEEGGRLVAKRACPCPPYA